MSKISVIDVEIDKLIPYVNNARTHSKKQIKQLAAAIKEFGFRNPILIDEDNGILAGHGRVMAVELLGRKTIPCIRAIDLTETQKKAYILSDNKHALNAGWDEELLNLELEGLADAGFDLDLVGFDDEELSFLDKGEGNEGLTDPDEVPDVPEVPRTKLGDVWLLGEHRVMCGDSTDEASVHLLMDGKKADMVFTDPPYQMESSEVTAAFGAVNDIVTLCTFKQAIGLVEEFNFHFDFVFVANLPKSFMNQKQPYYLHVTGVYLTRDGNSSFHCSNAKGVRSENSYWATVIDAPRDVSKHGHGKSVEAVIFCLSGWKHKLVFDPFLGSGTTLIACEKAGRHCYGMELDPRFCDVIIERWETFTGKKARLAV